MKLSETNQGDLIKFNKNSKVDWFVAYKSQPQMSKQYIEIWSSNDTTYTITKKSKRWNRKVIKIN